MKSKSPQTIGSPELTGRETPFTDVDETLSSPNSGPSHTPLSAEESLNTSRSDTPYTPMSSDESHNLNCYLYFKKIQLNPLVLSKLSSEARAALKEESMDEYVFSYPYGDLYKYFFDTIDACIDDLYARASPQQMDALDVFVRSIYDNDNHILDATYRNIQPVILHQSSSHEKIEHLITKHVRDDEFVNTLSKSPHMKGKIWEDVFSSLSSTYKPQHETSLSTIRHYRYRDENPTFKEYRFGTQAQRHGGVVRVSPLFQHFIASLTRTGSPTVNSIVHIYFNNLPRDIASANIIKQISAGIEVSFTQVLENLEKIDPHIAVITLPAAQALFDVREYKGANPQHDTAQTHALFLNIARGSGSHPGDDFYISPRLRALIFPQGDQEEKLNELLKHSFRVMGLSDKTTLTNAERQAVWVHFIKFELTTHIIETLQPQGINFSCKDAIDRGGVASAYYNLMKSFQSEYPMTRDEFECALHAAPTMVKGRGMNHQINIIWNVVDHYIQAHESDFKEEQTWLLAWRDSNCPPERFDELFQRYLTKAYQWLNDTIDPTDLAKISIQTKGVVLLQMLAEENRRAPTSTLPPLLLEIARLTQHILQGFGNQEENRLLYEQLAVELAHRVRPSTLQRLSDMMSDLVLTILPANEQDPSPESPVVAIQRAMKQILSTIKVKDQATSSSPDHPKT